MKEKIQQAILDMKSKVERDSKHIYRNPITGDMYQGVSTVSSIVPKDWLAAWGAKEAVKFLGYTDYENDEKRAKEVLFSIQGFTIKQWISYLKEAKGAASRKSKQALVDGTAGHLWLEHHVESCIQGSTHIDIPINSPLTRPIVQFLEWEAKEVDYWIASEALIVNPNKRYAGQLDAIYMSKDGKLCLADFKFASHISEDYYLQTGGYSASFEQYGIVFDKRVIIRLPKTLEREEWNEKLYKYEMKPNDIEVHIVPTIYESDRDAFYAALIVKGWINSVTKKQSVDK